MDLLGNRPASQSQNRIPSSQSAQQASIPSRKLRPASSNISVAYPHSQAIQALLSNQAYVPSSRTWTPSSGGLGLLGDSDEVQDRAVFVEEYNRLARKHGVRWLVAGDFDFDTRGRQNGIPSPEKHGWLYRIFRGTSNQPTLHRATPISRTPHKRSVSDLGYLIRSRSETSKTIGIQDMVRLSGKSVLYLPPEYSPCSLTLPTCIRAAAQYIAQNATTRGIFRIPGSVKVVNSLYDYYCYAGNNGPAVSGTVCRTSLPTHIPYSVHDVASTFKRFLSVLPGGILGSLALFDAFIGIHSQLQGQPEFPRTKQTKVRARLIALAIGTIESQFRRELICAVFGLLSLIGRIAEVSPHEDCDGRPLPTNDLMGYNALGIVFGPLLVRDLLDRYAMRLATPTSGLLLFPMSPKKQRRDRQKMRVARDFKSDFPEVDKVMVAISIAEMLIANWRDVVRQMKALGAHFHPDVASIRLKHDEANSFASESRVVDAPVDSGVFAIEEAGDVVGRDCSPEPETPTRALRRRRSRLSRQRSGRELSVQPSYSQLTPTMEEGNLEKARSSPDLFLTASAGTKAWPNATNDGNVTPDLRPLVLEDDSKSIGAQHNGSIYLRHSCSCQDVSWLSTDHAPTGVTQSISMSVIPPRVSSRHNNHFGVSTKTPTIVISSGNTEISQMPSRDGDFAKTSKGAKGRDKIIHRTIRSPLSDRLQGKRRVFERLLTCSKEKLRNMQPNFYGSPPLELRDSGNTSSSLHCPIPPSIYTDEFVGDRMKPTKPAKPNRYAEANGPSDPTEWAATRSKAAGHGGSTIIGKIAPQGVHHGPLEPEMGDGEAKLPGLMSIGLDVLEDKTPTKRRSVRVLAAMFEGQHDPPLVMRKTRTGMPNEVTNSAEGIDQDKPIASRIHNSPQKSSHMAKALPSHPETVEHGRLRDIADERYSPSSNTWSLGTKVDDTRDAPVDVRENGTQTEIADNQVILASTSSITRCDYHDSSTMTNKEAVSHGSPSSEVDNLHSRLQGLEKLLSDKSAEAAQLQLRVQQLEEDNEVSSLRDQLRDAEKDIRKWREKAEAAERKAKMFQKFTARVRSIQGSLAAEGSLQSGDDLCGRLASEQGRDTEGSFQVHRVRFTKSSEATERGADSKFGFPDDRGVCSVKVEDCLHRSQSRDGSAPDGLKATTSDLGGLDGVASPKEERKMDFGRAAVELWIAAQELLLMEDEGASTDETCVEGERGEDQHI
ncbi:rho-gtpase-activating 6 [Trichoderma arundinaceum]|uniref:Rho-gtpase-activating 6 n=1 Tax=Trichoderma arundinaceum TaxID=490622 RepID=A0A395N9L1_TRIAR|nr:rho-gtpase-activating 6 [Trichoderma arundinaceum]